MAVERFAVWRTGCHHTPGADSGLPSNGNAFLRGNGVYDRRTDLDNQESNLRQHAAALQQRTLLASTAPPCMGCIFHYGVGLWITQARLSLLCYCGEERALQPQALALGLLVVGNLLSVRETKPWSVARTLGSVAMDVTLLLMFINFYKTAQKGTPLEHEIAAAAGVVATPVQAVAKRVGSNAHRRCSSLLGSASSSRSASRA